MDSRVKIFPTPYELAESFAKEMVVMIKESDGKGKPFTVALSGGSTPELLFSILGDHFSKSIPWRNVHLFWGDERCVPPESPESNYGMAKAKLIDRIDIPSEHVHRIRGEADPGQESLRYPLEIHRYSESRNGLPFFDLIMLGLGEDGHTASIFPGHTDLFSSDKVCDIAVHPVTGQKRITLTGRILNNAESVVFLVTGKKKAEVVGEIIKNNEGSENFPAAFIVPSSGKLTWFLDKDAGSLL